MPSSASAGSVSAGEGSGGTSVDAIAAEVEGIRELRFREVPEPEFLTSEETTDRVRELFLEEYTPEVADIEERILTAFGAIPPGTDLRELRAGTIGDQVAGYYEPESGELVVRQSGSEIGVLDRITLAHELDHALTDQVLGIPLPDDPELGREDESLAALALVEGDATVVMQRYQAGLGFGEQLELLDPAAIAQAEAGLAGLPPYLQKELLFPYQQGLEFVCHLFAEGGWAAVDEAYDRPPADHRAGPVPGAVRRGRGRRDRPARSPDSGEGLERGRSSPARRGEPAVAVRGAGGRGRRSRGARSAGRGRCLGGRRAHPVDEGRELRDRRGAWGAVGRGRPLPGDDGVVSILVRGRRRTAHQARGRSRRR